MIKNLRFITSIKIIFFLIIIIIDVINCFEKEMTISIDAGKQDCFFQNGKMGETIDIEYQVIDGGHGDLDISFELTEPNGRIIIADYKKSDNLHRHEIKAEGDYRFCFDNSFSNYNRKTVFFELIIETEEESQKNEWNNDILEGLTQEEFYDMKVQDIHTSIARVRAQITKVRVLQDFLRSFEARDRNLAEEQYFKVNAWSFFQIILMVIVGGIQVIMVRSLFDTNSKVHKLWSKFN